MIRFSMVVYVCVAISSSAFADTTPLPLGASDLVPNSRFESSRLIDLEHAFEAEATKQLAIDIEWEPLSDLDLLKQENALLKQRVSRLEKRLAQLEDTVKALEVAKD